MPFCSAFRCFAVVTSGRCGERGRGKPNRERREVGAELRGGHVPAPRALGIGAPGGHRPLGLRVRGLRRGCARCGGGWGGSEGVEAPGPVVQGGWKRGLRKGT